MGRGPNFPKIEAISSAGFLTAGSESPPVRDETPFFNIVGAGSTKVQAEGQGQTQGQDQVHADEQVCA